MLTQTLRTRYNFSSFSWTTLGLAEISASLILFINLFTQQPWVGFAGAAIALLSVLFVTVKLLVAKDGLANLIAPVALGVVAIIHILVLSG